MDREAYETTQQQLTLLAGIVAELPLEEFLEAIDRADAIGPIFHPTLWIRTNKTMSQIRDLAEAALEFKRAAVKVRGEVAAETTDQPLPAAESSDA